MIYFMHLSAILCPSNFRHGRVFPRRGGTEVMGGAVELARKAIPITSVPELHRQLKPVRDYFPYLLG